MTPKPTVHLLVTTNGRDEFLHRTVARNLKYLHGLDGLRVMVDDTGRPGHSEDLIHRYAAYDFTVLGPNPHAQVGQAAAIEVAWRYLIHHAEPGDYVFHLEDDFLILRDVDVADMVGLLVRHPNLAQVVLMRQAWFENEKRLGGVIPAREDQGGVFTVEVDHVIHADHWSFNPCLYPVSLIAEYAYPQRDWAEHAFGVMLAEAGKSFAYLGRPDDWPWVEHIGVYRALGGQY